MWAPPSACTCPSSTAPSRTTIATALSSQPHGITPQSPPPATNHSPHTVEVPYHLTQGSSQLSNVGTNSLKSLNRYISDKEIYEKQQKGYNIISVQPKEYEDTIKVYPKYRLENEDRNYYKKLQIEKEISNKLNTNKQLLQQLANPETQKKAVRGKYLNNVDEVADIM